MDRGTYIFEAVGRSPNSRSRYFEKMKEAGYSVESENFQRVTYYRIYLPGLFSPTEEDLEKFQEIRKQIKEEIAREDDEKADKIFAENVADDVGLCAYLPIGSEPDEIMFVPERYARVADFLYIDVAKLKNLSQSGITLTVPWEVFKKISCKKYSTYSLQGLISAKKTFAADEASRDDDENLNLDIKINYPDGSHGYILKDKDVWSSRRVPCDMNNSEHLDLDISNPQDREILIARNKLVWPSINGTEREMANRLEKLGFVVEHVGRSGFANRNRYDIKENGPISVEAIQRIKQAIEEQEQLKIREAYLNFEKSFDEQSEDPNKTYAFVRTGGDDSVRFDKHKYSEVLNDVVAYTADHRRAMRHTYLSLIINEERMRNDSRKTITLYVPKNMVGMVIGKGGKNIKALGEKYGKHFVVKESIVEKRLEARKAEEQRIEAERLREKLAAEAEIMARQKNVNNITWKLIEHLGWEIIDKSQKELREAMAQYLLEQQDTLKILPNKEELETIEQALIYEQISKKEIRLELIKENTLKMCEMMNEALQKKSITIMPEKEVRPFVEDLFKDREDLRELIPQISQIYEKKMKNRKAFSDEKLEPVVASQLLKFFENQEPHGFSFFNIVGKDRRRRARELITENVMRKQGNPVPEDGIYSEEFGQENRDLYNKVLNMVEEMSIEVSELECGEDEDFLREKAGRPRKEQTKTDIKVNVHVSRENPQTRDDNVKVTTNARGETVSNSFAALGALFGKNTAQEK